MDAEKPNPSNILQFTMFHSLSEGSKKHVRHFFNETKHLDTLPFKFDQKSLAINRKPLLYLFEFYTDKLHTALSGLLKFKTRERLQKEADDLLFAYYIIYAKYQLDETEHRRQKTKKLAEDLKKCSIRIDKIRALLDLKDEPENPVQQAVNDSEKPAKYCGLMIVAPFIAAKMEEFSRGKTSVIKEWMGDFNGRRLYWVWGGGFIRAIIEALPKELAANADKQLSKPSPFTGYLSWTLYYTRLGIEVGLLLKHTFKGPWMSKEEAEIPQWERFKTQWEQRKFSILNDFLWGIANMACFFFLKGPGRLGIVGNAITLGLLAFDITSSVIRFTEESTQHNKDIKRFNDEILQLKIKSENLIKSTTYSSNAEDAAIEKQIAELEKNKAQCEAKWLQKKYALVNNMVYAVGLCASFALMIGFFAAPVGITALALSISGAALTFVFTVGYAAVGNYFEMVEAKTSVKNNKCEIESRLQQFNEYKNQPGSDIDVDENNFIKKQLYLDIKLLVAKSHSDSATYHYKKLQLIRGIVLDSLLPPLILASFLFIPGGFGWIAVAAVIVVAIITHRLIESLKPKEQALSEWDINEEKAFNAFLSKPGDCNMDDCFKLVPDPNKALHSKAEDRDIDINGQEHAYI